MSRPLGTRIAALYELQAAWLEPRLKARGVRWGTFQLLMAIHSAGAGVSQVEVARRLGVTPATLSESVHSHVLEAFVEQRPSSADRRVKGLYLTDKATKLLAEIDEMLDQCEQAIAHGLSGKVVDSSVEAMDRMILNLEQSV